MLASSGKSAASTGFHCCLREGASFFPRTGGTSRTLGENDHILVHLAVEAQLNSGANQTSNSGLPGFTCKRTLV